MGVLVSSYCCSSYGATNPYSSLGTFSSSFIGDPVLHPMDDCEHPLLYMSGTGRASRETAISVSCQQALVGICNSVWVWWLFMGWIPRWGSLWMVFPSFSAPKFVFVLFICFVCFLTFSFFIRYFFIYISNVIPKIPYTLPPPCSPTHPLLLPGPGISLHWGIESSQDQGPCLPLMTDKAIFYYICS